MYKNKKYLLKIEHMVVHSDDGKKWAMSEVKDTDDLGHIEAVGHIHVWSGEKSIDIMKTLLSCVRIITGDPNARI